MFMTFYDSAGYILFPQKKSFPSDFERKLICWKRDWRRRERLSKCSILRLSSCVGLFSRAMHLSLCGPTADKKVRKTLLEEYREMFEENCRKIITLCTSAKKFCFWDIVLYGD